MTQGSMDERRNALEEEFFRKQNAEVIERLRATQERDKARRALAATSGITDPALLDRLADHGMDAASVAVMALVPLVAVAWADRKVEEKERWAVLREAADAGLTPDMAGYQLLDGWLREPPPPALLATWTEYAQALSSNLDPGDRRELRDSLLARATAVASAAGGGFVGRGSKVSEAEQAVLRSVEDALAG